MSKPQNVQDGTGVLAEVPGVGILDAYGTTVPSDGAAGYAIGCTFRHIDGGDETAIYVNEGSATSCDFNAISAA